MEKSYPLITVFVLTYNNFEYLNEAMESIYSQNYPNIELILSDDGSSNFDVEIFKNIKETSPKNIKHVKLIHHESNLGTVKNLNIALKSGRGKYFVGLSPDDLFYDESILSDVVDFFEEEDAMVVTTKRKVVDPSSNQGYEILPTKNDIETLNGSCKDLFERLCVSNFISGASTYHSRELFEAFGYFDEKYLLLEDYPKYLQLTRENVKVHYMDRITKTYRLGGISTSKVKNPKLIEDAKRTVEEEVIPFIDKRNKKLMKAAQLNYEIYASGKYFDVRYIIKYPFAYIGKVLNSVGLMKLWRRVR